MEYEIYLLCNILGIIILFLIIVFHFIDADHDNAKFFKENNMNEEESKTEALKRKPVKMKKEKKKIVK